MRYVSCYQRAQIRMRSPEKEIFHPCGGLCATPTTITFTKCATCSLNSAQQMAKLSLNAGKIA